MCKTSENDDVMISERIHRNNDRIAELQAEMDKLRKENLRLIKSRKKNQKKNSSSANNDENNSSNNDNSNDRDGFAVVEKLSAEHVERYSRQLILQEGFGVKGQLKLLNSSVLVVGAGGIGSTVLLYLAASGVGRLSVMDFDDVEICNLHRQVIHRSHSVGTNKAYSACSALRELNPSIECEAIPEALTHENAMDVVANHDCVVDASDNPQTRYLINDACVLAGKPLVSGSAIGSEGQLTVYNHGDTGPCYRCLYPEPSAAASTSGKSCSDNGVLGPVPGLIGILQATETLKVLTSTGKTMANRLLMYDSLQSRFLTLKTPPKRTDCPVSGQNPTIRSMEDSRLDAEQVRGPSCSNNNACQQQQRPTLEQELQLSCTDYYHKQQQRRQNQNENNEHHQDHVLLDVRVPQQYELCSLENSINIPLGDLPGKLEALERLSGGCKPIYCLCRRGIFSVEATRLIQTARLSGKHPNIHSVRNITGGLEAWRREVDPAFPKY